jgi:hypothetical protein
MSCAGVVRGAVAVTTWLEMPAEMRRPLAHLDAVAVRILERAVLDGRLEVHGLPAGQLGPHQHGVAILQQVDHLALRPLLVVLDPDLAARGMDAGGC